ncbi:type II secretion system protein N [Congregibacter sp.]|uniref:type II secretion system protein N n=1 Tax=Congregibacter sp. TaxID=2744308 RepID=UPI003F6B2F48
MRPLLWLLALLGAVLLLLFVSLQAPARLLSYVLNPQQIQLSAVSGTLSHGSAMRARVQTPGGYLHLGKVSWTLDPMSLLAFSPKVHLRSAWGDQRGTLDLRVVGDMLVIEDLDVSLDAALLQRVLPVELTGRLELLFSDLQVTRSDLVSAEGRLVWQGAAWQSPRGVHVLGSYAANITSPAKQQVIADVVTLSGPVMASGAVDLVEKRFTIDLRIESPEQALDPELAQALSLIASPEENGYRLRLDGEVAQGP